MDNNEIPRSTGQLGEVDLRSTYSTFSGIDTRIYIDGKVLGCIQSVDLVYLPALKMYTGTMTALILGQAVDDIVDRIHSHRIEIIGANEYGHKGNLISEGLAKVEQATVHVDVDSKIWSTTISLQVLLNETKKIPQAPPRALISARGLRFSTAST